MVSWCCTNSPAGSALERVAVAAAVVLHAAVVALALADEVDHDLHLLGEAQRFDLDGLRRPVVLGTALEGDADGEADLKEGREMSVKTTMAIKTCDLSS